MLSHFSRIQLCNSMDCSLPVSSIHGILQGRMLEWVAVPSSRGSSLTQGLNPCLLSLLHWQEDSLSLCCLGSLYHISHNLKIDHLVSQSAQTGNRKKTEKASSCSQCTAVYEGSSMGLGRRMREGPLPQLSPMGCSWALDLLPV